MSSAQNGGINAASSAAISVVIDTDTGSDDAVALLLAARSDWVTIRSVTTVAGNVPVAQGSRNALVTLETAGRSDVAVYQGIAKPLMRPASTAQHVHGEDGMSGVPFAAPTRSVEAMGGVEHLVHIAQHESGQHCLVTLGPLTNIAAAITLDPLFLTRFTSVVSMGGAFDGVGNVHRAGEYNIWADPEAAAIVLAAEGTVTFVGWDMSRRHAVITPDQQQRWRQMGHFGEFVVDINAAVDTFCRTHNNLAGYDLPDPLAMAVAIDPAVATGRQQVNVAIGLDDAGRGGTFVDRRLVADTPNAEIVTDIDRDRFIALIEHICRP